MKINGNQILHVVDRDTRFSSATILHGESTSDVWKSYLEIWVNKYVGFPDVISVDQGPQFQSKEWKSLLQLAGIKFKPSGVEHHNAINVGERYHSFLRKIFHKIESSHPSYSASHVLSIAVRVMNDTAGPNGLVPTLLVFGILPRIPLIPTQLPSQVARFKVMKEARTEMMRIVAKSKLKTALKGNVPSASSRDLRAGDSVLVYREPPINKWVGPFEVINIDKKMAHLDYNGELKLYAIDKLKRYNDLPRSLPAPPGLIQEAGTPSPSDDSPDLLKEIEEMKNAEEDNNLSIRNDLIEDLIRGTRNDANTYLTTTVRSGNPISNSEIFEKAKQAEINGLKDRGTWTVLKRSELQPDSNILGGRFVLTLKNSGLQTERAKARFVAQGHRDLDKEYMVHNLTTLRQSSIRLILSITAVKKFRLFSHDVTQAYLQSEDSFSRDLYLVPSAKDRKYFGIDEYKVLKLEKPLYGTCDAGDYWNKTITNHTKNDLKMKSTKGDPSLFYKLDDNMQLEGVMGIYVDDEVLAGTNSFEKLTEKTLSTFESSPRIYRNFEFFGIECRQTVDGVCSLSQKQYITKIAPLPLDASFAQFRSARACLSWITHTRPDIAYIVNWCAQKTETQWSENNHNIITRFNKALKFVKKST